jgi:two-component system, sensor histidine kinase and response regulator
VNPLNNTSELGSRKPTILVVDDQERNIQLVGTLLQLFNYEIVPATSGEQALKRVASRRPDLILLDVLMPGMGGIEACRRIKETPGCEDIPIIFLSAADDKNLVVEGLESGGVDYVAKPFNKAELLSRVNTQIALKDTRDQLKMLAADKDELLGMLAHDLKNHLSGMQLSAQLLRDRSASALDDKSRQLVDNMADSTSKLLSFVKELLANASVDHAVMTSPQRINLAEHVAMAIRRYEEAAAQKRTRLYFHEPRQPVAVSADPEGLGRILDNLLSNAIKFSPPGSAVNVTVSASDDESTGAVEVTDEGPGIPEVDRAKLFRRYARLTAQPTGGEPSSGLGLSIAKRLAEMMRGDLACHPPDAGGATFRLRLNAAKPA